MAIVPVLVGNSKEEHAPKVVVVAAAAGGAFMVILAIESVGACGHGGSSSSKY